MDVLCRAIADATRRAILDELVERDGQSLFEICGRLAMKHGINSSRQAISQHLDVLEEAGLVVVERQGRCKFHWFNGALRDFRQVADDKGREKQTMRIHITSVYVDDQEKALRFYTDVLGFVKKSDIPLGTHRWLTVVEPGESGGTELLLEPNEHPAVKPYVAALVADGIRAASFAVADAAAEHKRLADLGVQFTQLPTDLGVVVTAVLDDTCGNLIQIVELKAA